MNQPSIDDIAALREDGDLKTYLLALTGRTPAKQATAVAVAPEPGYRIAHVGGWPIGSAATGRTPTHDRCTCPKCEQAAVVALPVPAGRREGEAA